MGEVLSSKATSTCTFSRSPSTSPAPLCIAMVACIVRRIANRALDTRPGDIVVWACCSPSASQDSCWKACASPAGRPLGRLVCPWGASSQDCSLAGTKGRSGLPIACCGGSIWPSPSGLIAYWSIFQARPRAARARRRLLARPGKGELPFIDMEDEGPALLRLRPLGGAHVEGSLRHPGLRALQPCRDLCPAYATGKPLSPKAFIQDLGAELEQRGPSSTACRRPWSGTRRMPPRWKASRRFRVPRPRRLAPRTPISPTPGAPSSIARSWAGHRPETLWTCTTCGRLHGGLPGLRGARAEGGEDAHLPECPLEARSPDQAHLRSLENNGSPWGLGWQTHAKWAEAGCAPPSPRPLMPVPPTGPAAPGPSTTPRKVSAALVSLLAEAGVSFAIWATENAAGRGAEDEQWGSSTSCWPRKNIAAL